MCVISNSLPATKTHKCRSYAWVASPGGPLLGVLTICQGRNTKDTKTYAVRECPANGLPGRVFQLLRRGAEGVYTVFVGQNGQDCFCDCDGFAYHGHCKHIDSVRAALHDGCFDPDDEVPAADWPSAAQVSDDAARDLPECYRGEGVPF